MLQMSGVPVWAKDRTKHDPLIVMGGAASFLNPEPIAEFTDVIAVGEGEILGPKLDRRHAGKRNEGRNFCWRWPDRVADSMCHRFMT